MKIERLINIIMLLLENDTISANSLAQRFSVSKRTILRDMDSLILAHIPIYTTRGPKGGFGIMDSYKFNKRLLTEFDIQNILIALSGLSEFTADKETALTIDKLKSLLPNKMNNLKTLIDFEEIHEALSAAKKLIFFAIQHSKTIEISYIDQNGQQTERKVEPYQLYYKNTSWYLYSYSLDKGDFRTFKLSRITSISLLEKEFDQKSFKSTDNTNPNLNFFLSKIEVIVHKKSRDKLIEGVETGELLEVDKNHYQTTLVLPDHEFGYQYLANFGTTLKIIGPDFYLKNYVEWLEKIISINKK